MSPSLGRDPHTGQHPLTLAPEAYSPFRVTVFQGIGRELAVYLRPCFHQDDIDTRELLRRWQKEPFDARTARSSIT
ncbi:hypothetical protein ACQP1G_27490 [Nocardia sp. CA-107356]|uniref:hypothetical protein n=1 Tax=Nocardia sp. CA-107356 TaxID=3239972 RepID=UPI003D8B7CE3